MITAAVCNVSVNVFFIVLIITTEKRAENNSRIIVRDDLLIPVSEYY
jgi:hypothetical protein